MTCALPEFQLDARMLRLRLVICAALSAVGTAPAQAGPDSRLNDRSDKPRIVPRLKVTTALLKSPSELMLKP